MSAKTLKELLVFHTCKDPATLSRFELKQVHQESRNNQPNIVLPVNLGILLEDVRKCFRVIHITKCGLRTARAQLLVKVIHNRFHLVRLKLNGCVEQRLECCLGL